MSVSVSFFKIDSMIESLRKRNFLFRSYLKREIGFNDRRRAYELIRLLVKRYPGP